MKKEELGQFKLVRENFELNEWCRPGGESLVVNVYLDEKSSTAIQVDLEMNIFRTADATEVNKYGDWEKFK